MDNEKLTPSQQLEHALGKIRAYALRHSLTGQQIHDLFNVGIAAVVMLHPVSALPSRSTAYRSSI